MKTTTRSICPECQQTIDATIQDRDGTIYMTKACEEHGQFKDRICDDKTYHDWTRQFLENGGGVQNCSSQKTHGCPHDCGPCENHKSGACLAIIDVTNRCNLKCPICFANAETAGYTVVERVSLIP